MAKVDEVHTTLIKVMVDPYERKLNLKKIVNDHGHWYDS